MPEQLPHPAKKRYIRMRVTGDRQTLNELHPMLRTQAEALGYKLGFFWLAPLSNNENVWELKTGYKQVRDYGVRTDNEAP